VNEEEEIRRDDDERHDGRRVANQERAKRNHQVLNRNSHTLRGEAFGDFGSAAAVDFARHRCGD